MNKATSKGILLITIISILIISCISQDKEGSDTRSLPPARASLDNLTDPGVHLLIEPEDSVMSTTDVNIVMSIVNNDTTDIVLYYSLSFESIAAAMNTFLFFDIIHEGDQRLVFNSTGPQPKMPHISDTLVLNRLDIYRETINLTEFYIDSARVGYAEEDIWPKRHWNPGSYSVQCTYRYIHNPSWIGGRDLWEGEITSNKISVTVE